ncbi:hypothetical protein ABW16_01230 [Mycolicibacter heraklionensis]|uniref:Uncharacterized protein n=1 Tax=Mycolicibacter heraklionensis TaxID=512402 RepID=A0ABR5FKD6_9MYCO|nr:hypothetical protein [Mycolicibacter heraklionensis]KLO31500.1 hypothetical protein ABW16_01230 [Mycolicibacter heraklionensis]
MSAPKPKRRNPTTGRYAPSVNSPELRAVIRQRRANASANRQGRGLAGQVGAARGADGIGGGAPPEPGSASSHSLRKYLPKLPEQASGDAST